jgi:hypothetical protein
MPGFTAEAAVFHSGSQFEARAAAPSDGKAVVTPQACVNIGPCKVCVDVSVFPPKACVKFSCLGFNKSFCVP